MVFYVVTVAFPVVGMGDIDDVDTFGTFTPDECKRLGIAPPESPAESGTADRSLEKTEMDEKAVVVDLEYR